MNGSEKQIKWASDIKAQKAGQFAELRKQIANEIGFKAVDYIESNDNASFWIDYRDQSAKMMLGSLLRGGLQVKGFGFDHKATMDTTTGVITMTWQEIVQDGKGGHKETRTQTF